MLSIHTSQLYAIRQDLPFAELSNQEFCFRSGSLSIPRVDKYADGQKALNTSRMRKASLSKRGLYTLMITKEAWVSSVR